MLDYKFGHQLMMMRAFNAHHHQLPGAREANRYTAQVGCLDGRG